LTIKGETQIYAISNEKIQNEQPSQQIQALGSTVVYNPLCWKIWNNEQDTGIYHKLICNSSGLNHARFLSLNLSPSETYNVKLQ
jgi:hypothetical protein